MRERQRRNAQDGKHDLSAVQRDELSVILLYNMADVTLASHCRNGQRTDCRIILPRSVEVNEDSDERGPAGAFLTHEEDGAVLGLHRLCVTRTPPRPAWKNDREGSFHFINCSNLAAPKP